MSILLGLGLGAGALALFKRWMDDDYDDDEEDEEDEEEKEKRIRKEEIAKEKLKQSTEYKKLNLNAYLEGSPFYSMGGSQMSLDEISQMNTDVKNKLKKERDKAFAEAAKPIKDELSEIKKVIAYLE